MTTVLCIMLPSGILALPLMKYSLETWGNLPTLHIVNLLGVLAYVPLLFRNLWVQAVTCALYPLYRGLLYAALTTFVAQAFGAQSVGRVFGFVCLSAALLQPIQYPMVESMSEVSIQKGPDPACCVSSLLSSASSG